MSDPAVEAAERAWEADQLSTWPSQNAVAGAHEALEPIRTLHQPKWLNCMNACCSGEECRHRTRYCGHCEFDWPCDTAKLAYSADELA